MSPRLAPPLPSVLEVLSFPKSNDAFSKIKKSHCGTNVGGDDVCDSEAGAVAKSKDGTDSVSSSLH